MSEAADRTFSEALIANVKRSVDITWDDTATDQDVLDKMERGKAYIDDKLGEPADYESPGYPQTLLIEYVRYARDKALDVFENNYTSMILAMQNNRKVSLIETVEIT